MIPWGPAPLAPKIVTWSPPHQSRKSPSLSKIITGCSLRVKTKTLSCASTATSATSTKELLSKRVEIPFRINSGSVRRSRHLVDLATL